MQYRILTFKVEVKGIVNDRFVYRYYDENGNRGKEIIINKDGIYELPMSYSVETNTGVGIVCNNICQDNVCFTQIPDYPNQLCYDGMMYAVAYGLPILTDYTIIADRTILDSQTGSYGFISKRQIPGIGGAFVLEKDENTGIPNAFRTFSFNTSTIIYPNKKQSIVYQTKTSYNGKDISFGITKDTDFLLIGAGLYNKNPNINAITEQMKITHGDILLFNRSLTEYEISWVKNNMMCSKQQEPDIDL